MWLEYGEEKGPPPEQSLATTPLIDTMKEALASSYQLSAEE